MSRIATIYRWAALGLVLASWAILAVMMWRAFHTLPSAEQLADARPVRPPLPADLLLNLAESLAVALLLAGMLWPSRARRYILRVAIVLIVLVAWFIMTVPLDLNTMEWLHRRWLALMIVMLLLTLFAYPLLNRITRRETPR